MASLATAGTRLYHCPTCNHLTPYPSSLDQPPVCVKCLQGYWPDDPIKRNREDEAAQIIVLLTIGGMFILAVSAILSKLGYL